MSRSRTPNFSSPFIISQELASTPSRLPRPSPNNRRSSSPSLNFGRMNLVSQEDTAVLNNEDSHNYQKALSLLEGPSSRPPTPPPKDEARSIGCIDIPSSDPRPISAQAGATEDRQTSSRCGRLPSRELTSPPTLSPAPAAPYDRPGRHKSSIPIVFRSRLPSRSRSRALVRNIKDVFKPKSEKSHEHVSLTTATAVPQQQQYSPADEANSTPLKHGSTVPQITRNPFVPKAATPSRLTFTGLQTIEQVAEDAKIEADNEPDNKRRNHVYSIAKTMSDAGVCYRQVQKYKRAAEQEADAAHTSAATAQAIAQEALQASCRATDAAERASEASQAAQKAANAAEKSCNMAMAKFKEMVNELCSQDD